MDQSGAAAFELMASPKSSRYDKVSADKYSVSNAGTPTAATADKKNSKVLVVLVCVCILLTLCSLTGTVYAVVILQTEHQQVKLVMYIILFL